MVFASYVTSRRGTSKEKTLFPEFSLPSVVIVTSMLKISNEISWRLWLSLFTAYSHHTYDMKTTN